MDQILKHRMGKCIDWQQIDKKDYLNAMGKSLYDATKIKKLLNSALTEEINDREIFTKWVRRSGSRDTG